MRHRVGGVVAERRAHQREERRRPRDGLALGEAAGERPGERIGHQHQRDRRERSDRERRSQTEAEREEQRIARGEDAPDMPVVREEEAAAHRLARLAQRPSEGCMGERSTLEEVHRGVDDARPAVKVEDDVAEREEAREERAGDDHHGARRALEQQARARAREQRGGNEHGGDDHRAARDGVRRCRPVAEEGPQLGHCSIHTW